MSVSVVCGRNSDHPHTIVRDPAGQMYECRRCGKYCLLGRSEAMLRAYFGRNQIRRSLLSHRIRITQRVEENAGGSFVLAENDLKNDVDLLDLSPHE